MPYTKTRCETCHERMMSRDCPTPLEYSTELLDVKYFDDKLELANNPQFSSGWLVGIEGDAEADSNPFPLGPNVTAQRAWLVGFVAGKFATEMGFSTPVCYDPNSVPEDAPDGHDDGELPS